MSSVKPVWRRRRRFRVGRASVASRPAMRLLAIRCMPRSVRRATAHVGRRWPPRGADQPVQRTGQLAAVVEVGAHVPDHVAGVAQAGVDVDEAEELGLEVRVVDGMSEDAALHRAAAEEGRGRSAAGPPGRPRRTASRRSRGCGARGRRGVEAGGAGAGDVGARGSRCRRLVGAAVRRWLLGRRSAPAAGRLEFIRHPTAPCTRGRPP